LSQPAQPQFTPDSVEQAMAIVTQGGDYFLRGDTMAGLEGVERRMEFKQALAHLAGFVGMSAQQMRAYAAKAAQTPQDAPAPKQAQGVDGEAAAPNGSDCGCPDPTKTPTSAQAVTEAKE
jgi:hypothetical protein